MLSKGLNPFIKLFRSIPGVYVRNRVKNKVSPAMRQQSLLFFTLKCHFALSETSEKKTEETS